MAREPDPPDLAPDLEQTEVDGGRADGARIVDAALPRVEALVACELTGCDLANAEGRGAKLMRVRIERSRLARLEQCRLRGCELGGLAGAESLRGAGIPRDDVVRMAEVWAAALGLDVLDD